MTRIDKGHGSEKGKDSMTTSDSVLRSTKGSRKVLRSPIMSTSQPIVLEEVREERDITIRSEVATPTNVNSGVTELDLLVGQSNSPRLEQIMRMREIEEESLRKCVAILRNMGQALERQKNISKEVKDGISVLNEQMDVIESCRRTWKDLERTRNLEAERAVEECRVQKTTNLHPTCEEETPVTGRTKRAASSPLPRRRK